MAIGVGSCVGILVLSGKRCSLPDEDIDEDREIYSNPSMAFSGWAIGFGDLASEDATISNGGESESIFPDPSWSRVSLEFGIIGEVIKVASSSNVKALLKRSGSSERSDLISSGFEPSKLRYATGTGVFSQVSPLARASSRAASAASSLSQALRNKAIRRRLLMDGRELGLTMTFPTAKAVLLGGTYPYWPSA